MTATAPDPAAALEALLPRLRRIQAEGWALVLAALAAGVAGGSRYIRAFTDPRAAEGLEVWFFLLVLGVATLFFVPWWTRRRQEVLILPELARAMGLAWHPRDPVLLAGLPDRLLPRDRCTRRAGDGISGPLAGRQMRFARVHAATAGKKSRVLFAGVVMELPLTRALPDFLVILRSETERWTDFSGRVAVDDLARIDTVRGQGVTWAVYASTAAAAAEPGFRAAVEILTGLDSTIGGDARLYGAYCDRRRLWLAFSRRGDLFRIGGLAAGRDRFYGELRRAAENLRLPLRLVEALTEVEARAAAEGAAPLPPETPPA